MSEGFLIYFGSYLKTFPGLGMNENVSEYGSRLNAVPLSVWPQIATQDEKFLILGQEDTLNPLPPSDAVRKQKKNRGSFQFSFVTVQKMSPSGHLKFDYLGIFQILKLRMLMEKNYFNFSQAKFHSKYFGL